jgi:phage tail sheath protein FI
MPATLTYPGVYIEEVPSGVRPIAGVATSIAAFVGWAARGPVDKATLVQSWAEYERTFGGRDRRSSFGHSVSHFFANGGQQAYIVRLVAGDAGTAGVAVGGVLDVAARNPGDWAKDYGVTTKIRADDATRFRIQVVYRPQGATADAVVESFENLSMIPGDRRDVVKVLETESSFIRAAVLGGATSPPADTVAAQILTGAANLDGTVLQPDSPAFETALQSGGGTGGVNLLDQIDLFNLLCVPGETSNAVVSELEKFCRDRRAFLVVDAPQGASFTSLQNGPDPTITGADAINAALYFPWVLAPDPLQENRPAEYPPSPLAAGIYARTDSQRGVWKAPAGTDASLTGVLGLRTVLTDLQNGQLNIRAINCLRTLTVFGNVVWGARTLRGNNEVGSEWKYVPVRRMALFIEETLYRSTKWVVFEPNDEPLWAQIRLNIGAFMQTLFVQGAFQGSSPREAYFVKCDKETTTQADIDNGIVNIVVGFAPLKPAEFVVIKIQQIAQQAQV